MPHIISDEEYRNYRDFKALGMTDYLNPHRIYPDDTSRRIDNPPGNDSIRQGSEETAGRVEEMSEIERDALGIREDNDAGHE